IVHGRRGAYKKELEALRQRGYVEVRVDGQRLPLDPTPSIARNQRHDIEVVVDRISLRNAIQSRLEGSLETATRLAQGTVVVLVQGVGRKKATVQEEWLLSLKRACARCGVSFPELAPRSFSFNSPAGACEACDGLGVRLQIDPDRIVPNPDAPLLEAIEPWQRKRYRRFYAQLLSDIAEHLAIEVSTPWKEIPEDARRFILRGGSQKVTFSVGEKPTRSGRSRKTRVKRTFRGALDDLEQQSGSQLDRYRASTPCVACAGSRLKAEARAVSLEGKALHEICALSIGEVHEWFGQLEVSDFRRREVVNRIVQEIRDRLGFLCDVGLDYLTLDRATSTLSGGEAQRIRLATQVGSEMLGVLYILDEPSIGLHPRDNDRLIASLIRLRDKGNSVVIVEHDETTIRAADFVIDMGPGAGTHGGEVVATGDPSQIEGNDRSPTGAWLSGEKRVVIPPSRRSASGWLSLRGCRSHNLQNIDFALPLGTFTVLTGVSGSGKSTLVNDTLHRALAAQLHGAEAIPGEFDRLEGVEAIHQVIDVDQAPIGRTPRSNPATYTGALSGIRQLFSQIPEARARGYGPGRFSFNVKGGRCEACEGAGRIRVEMNFLPDLFVTCEVCSGRRYEAETLEILYKGRNMADVLDMTVEEALPWMENIPTVQRPLQALMDVGLHYLRLGQPATTLSGGEAQRVKLAKELARRSHGRTLYLLDEPTTGLHFSDVARLVELLQKLVERGNTVLVIEHHLDVIQSADHVVDLGPGGGSSGGAIVATGSPEDIAQCPESWTGAALAQRARAR
ncbi:excinuclease ABC subunit UvrA, partial [Myxococcota bacterium]|nr:excinuclease ABC subunit UvrA [Myxococcota bacterium]